MDFLAYLRNIKLNLLTHVNHTSHTKRRSHISSWPLNLPLHNCIDHYESTRRFESKRKNKKTLLLVERAEYILHVVLVVERAEIYLLLEHRIIVRRSMYAAYMFSPWRLLPFFYLSKVANGMFSFTKMH